ncbi:FG-GAP-like repeat-containing protein [Hymenobacter sp. 15J16-1T3B]|uniref:FG-GAP-like repeat-containing protein n=1 Tax=Hymenobacter sp. 15J16-1T3B TaxID=2886941 RepID=UPI001D101215|nr:FG-GAP-like repeat-containing protein [Hymenobacter sp. 15J16-1T3B]MCC3157456.1 FG-GAP-like repeat-containing protein [Hymenobacter sp. 15J16-1T3B]
MAPVFASASSSIRRAALAGFLGLLATAAQAQTISSFSPQGGVTGTQITITGLALGNTSAVLLNGQPMPIVSKGTTQVTVKIPAAASSGKILLVSTVSGVSTSAVSSNVLFATRTSAGVYLPQVGTAAVIAAAGTTAGQYSTPTFADLNNDGAQDLLVGYSDGTIKSYTFNSAAGTFGAGVNLTNTTGNTVFTTVAGTAGSYAKPTATDLDGDGLLDLIVGTGTNQTLARYEQTTAGGTAFGAQQLLTASYTNTPTSFFNIDMGYNYPRPVVTDLDGNGKLDLIVGDDNGMLARFEQLDNTTNAGKFSTLTTSTTAAFSYLKLANGTTIDVGNTSKPQVTDLDGDGKIDLLVGTRTGYVQRYEQSVTNGVAFNDLGTVAYTNTNTAIKVGTAGTDNNYAAPAIGDVDGDGVEDLAIGSNDGAVMRFEQVAATPTPLPVVLTSFGGQATPAGVKLSWITAQEKNSAAFYVERSADGKIFATVGEVAAAGNSTTARSYQFLDAGAAGTRYYRLRQVDQDGTTDYSAVVVVSSQATVAGPGAAAYPNPFVDALYVALPAGTEPQAAHAELLNLAGQPIFSAKLQLQATPQPLSGLPALTPGIYVLRLTTAAGTTTVQRLVRR